MAKKITRVRRRATADPGDDRIPLVAGVLSRSIAAYRGRVVDRECPLIVLCPLFFAELREVQRKKVYRKRR